MVKAVTSETGIILIPPYRDLEASRLTLSFKEHDAKMLFFLTYFKHVVVLPFNINFGFAVLMTSTLLEQTLVQQEVIKVFLYNPLSHSSFDSEFIGNIADNVYTQMNENESGTWAIAPTQDIASVWEDGEINTLVAILRQCLPCPHPEVSLVDILSFRNENDDKLNRLFSHISRLLLSIREGLSADDIRYIITNDLTSSIDDVSSAYDRSKIRFFNVDLEVSLALPSSLVASCTAALATIIHNPVVLTLAGWGLGQLAFNLTANKLGRHGNQYPAEFQYVLSGLRRGILASDPNDPEYANDLDNVTLENNAVTGFYPERLTQPLRTVGSSFRHCLVT